MKANIEIRLTIDIPDELDEVEEAYGRTDITARDAIGEELSKITVQHEDGLDLGMPEIRAVQPIPDWPWKSG